MISFPKSCRNVRTDLSEVVSEKPSAPGRLLEPVPQYMIEKQFFEGRRGVRVMILETMETHRQLGMAATVTAILYSTISLSAVSEATQQDPQHV